MQKTSFRIDDDTAQALAALAEQCHNGNRTAALVEAVRRYWQSQTATPAEVVQPVGWVQVRVSGKVRCGKCHNAIDGAGFASLQSDGSLLARLHCSRCAK